MNAKHVMSAFVRAIGLMGVALGVNLAQAGTATNCCTANDTPGCDDAECEATVCAIDKFCCDIEWDGTCADLAVDECAPCFDCGSAGAGDCCQANGTPFCNDADCCETVCASDPFCCSVQWDAICAAEARNQCGLCPEPPGCGDLDAGGCCEANNTTACDDAACCTTVCAQDPFCCDIQWDDQCAQQAVNVCQACIQCGSDSAGDCCEANDTPYCDDRQCCETVCAIDKFCCDIEWDGACADIAGEECDACLACGDPNAGDCCAPNGTPACNDARCCASVCAVDPFCCEVQWDVLCAIQAYFDRACACGSN